MPGLSPLAERMRPSNLDDYIGQQHLVGKGSILRIAINKGHIPSLILWGPPGVGKTTLAFIISQQLDRHFFSLSAINSGVKDVREVIDKSSKIRESGHDSPILFIDEIHRFTKSQQDSLLGAVERGYITLIGATTENPSFEIISPLLSRCQVYILKPLEERDLKEILHRAIDQDEILCNKKISIKEYEALFRLSGGDARKILNTLELVIDTPNQKEVIITNALVLKHVQQNLALYDKTGEQHYDIISAFIKSIRGSDPNAAVYWLARMITGGEDPLFIARRLLILASEDIGNANPNALLLANNCFQAVHTVGWPEARIILSQTVIFLASSPKSNASYEAINKAQELVTRTGNQSVPLHLRNAPTKLMKSLEYGKEYQYSHAYQDNFSEQEYFPESLSGTQLYEPGKNTAEEKLRERLKKLWNKKYNY